MVIVEVGSIDNMEIDTSVRIVEVKIGNVILRMTKTYFEEIFKAEINAA